MIRHILYATDGSNSAERAGGYVASFAIRYHAEVTVLHVFILPPGPDAGYDPPNIHAFASQKDAEHLAETVAERLRNLGVHKVATKVAIGQPTTVILGVAETIKPDMIILGARGLSTWQGLLLGSVSASVVQRAETPVLIVK